MSQCSCLIYQAEQKAPDELGPHDTSNGEMEQGGGKDVVEYAVNHGSKTYLTKLA